MLSPVPAGVRRANGRPTPKQHWYERNGVVEGQTLFTSIEESGRGLDSAGLKATALTVENLID